MPNSIAALATSPRLLSWIAAMAEALTLPLLLLRQDGVLLNANMAGYRELSLASPLQLLADDRVVPADAAHRDDFAATLVHAVQQGGRCVWRGERQGTGASGRAVLGAAAVTGGPVDIVITPIAMRRKDDAPMLMLMLPAEASMAEACTMFAYQYGLSAGELGVLHALCHGRTPREIALERGVSVSTVRTQLARLRRKCGEHSLGTLMPRLSQMPPVARRA